MYQDILRVTDEANQLRLSLEKEKRKSSLLLAGLIGSMVMSLGITGYFVLVDTGPSTEIERIEVRES